MQYRFIPVLTGNTFHAAEHGGYHAVYPRAYGEHGIATITRGSNSGLSPCLRGTLKGLVERELASRFIPVLTGNTFNKSEMYTQ